MMILNNKSANTIKKQNKKVLKIVLSIQVFNFCNKKNRLRVDTKEIYTYIRSLYKIRNFFRQHSIHTSIDDSHMVIHHMPSNNNSGIIITSATFPFHYNHLSLKYPIVY